MHQIAYFKQKALLFAAFFILLTLTGTQIAQAVWAPPMAAPPGGNVASPINTSGTSQTKQGSLTIGGEYLALPTAGIFFSHSAVFSEPHLNFGFNTLYLSPGNTGDHTELQGKVKITQAGVNQGELSVQNLINCTALETDAEGKISCGIGGTGDSLWEYSSGNADWAQMGAGPNYIVDGLEEYNGLLVAGGFFLKIGETPVYSLAAWDGNNWMDIGMPPYYGVRTLEIYNNELYVGGGDNFGDTELYKWDGSNWASIGNYRGPINDMAVYNNDLVIVGGITQVNGIPVRSAARWNGTNWSAMGNNGLITPKAVAVYNGELYVAGNSGIIWKWNEGGGNWVLFATHNNESRIYDMFVYSNELVVGGNFTQINGAPFSKIAKWNGVNWSSLDTGITGPAVNSLSLYNGDLLVAGNFTGAGGVVADDVAVWDGTSWSAIGSGTNGQVFDSIQYHGSLVIGGDFTIAGGAPIDYIAQLSDVANAINPINPDMTKVAIGHNSLADDTQLSVKNNSLNAAIYSEQANTLGWAGFFSGKTAIVGGNVGIGTTYPSMKLTINASNNQGILFADENNNPLTYLTQEDSGYFTINAGSGLGVKIIGDGNSDTFYVKSNRVGIKTSNLTSDLTLNGNMALAGGIYKSDGATNYFGACAADSSIRVINADGSVICEQDDSGGGTDNYTVMVTGSDTTPSYLNQKLFAGNNITFSVQNAGGDEKLRIDAVGLPAGSSGQTLRHNGTNWLANSLLFNNGAQVSVGITDPSNRFEVGQDLGGYLALRRDDADNDINAGDDLGALYFTGDHGAISDIIGAQIKAKAADDWALNNYTTKLSFYTRAPAGEVERLTIDSMGRVGIGTPSPQAQLHLTGTIRTPMANCTYLRTDANGEITCVGSGTPPGTSWETMGPGLNGTVRALAVFGGALYAGGEFTQSASTTVNYIARWDPVTSSWRPLANGLNGTVHDLYGDDTELWAVGSFTRANGQPAKYVAVWNGSTWISKDSEEFNAPINAVHECHANNYYQPYIVVGGDFNFVPVGHERLQYIARWVNEEWDDMTDPSSRVQSMGRYDVDDCVVGGDFIDLGGQSVYRAYMWNGSGARFQYGSSQVGFNNTVYAFANRGTETYIGGAFTAYGYGGANLRRLAQTNGTNSLTEFANVNNTVYALTFDSGNNLVAGGAFSTINGISLDHIGRYRNLAWEAIGAGLNGQVNEVVLWNGDLVAAGSFNASGSQPVSNIALWND